MDNSLTQDELYWKNRPLDDKKRDWDYEEPNWVLDYSKSQAHSHRGYIIEMLSRMDFESLLEIGCNAGPNLSLISEFFSGRNLAGFDTNEYAVSQAKLLVPTAEVKIGSLYNMEYPDKSFDVVLSDAVLI